MIVFKHFMDNLVSALDILDSNLDLSILSEEIYSSVCKIGSNMYGTGIIFYILILLIFDICF